jgi:hypothetical protein
MVYFVSVIDRLHTLGFITGTANFQHPDIINEGTKKGKSCQSQKEFRK